MTCMARMALWLTDLADLGRGEAIYDQNL